MGKAFGILFIVVLVWVGLEVYTEGTRGAFGGVFASWSGEPVSAEEDPSLSTPQRAGKAWQRSQDAASDRLARQVGEGY